MMTGEFKKKLFYVAVITAALAVILILHYRQSEVLTQIEFRTYDWRMQFAMSRKPSDTVVIATIDDKSLNELGRWPWNRSMQGEILGKLVKLGASVVAVDALYPEPSDDDDAFMRGLSPKHTVLAVALRFDQEAGSEHVPMSLIQRSTYRNSTGQPFDIVQSNGIVIPLPEFIARSRGIAHINMFPDIDGTARKEYVALDYNGEAVPSLAVQAYRIYKGIGDDEMLLQPGQALFLRDQRIPLEEDSGFLIKYTGPDNMFKRISLSDVYLDRLPDDALKGKIVLVGATALGIYDLRVTPTSQNMPGIEKHANVVQNLLNNDIIHRLPERYTVLSVIILYAAFLVVGLRSKVLGITLLGTIGLVAVAVVSLFLFEKYDLWFNFTYPFMGNVLFFLCALGYKYAVEERSGREVRKMFSSYVTEKIVDELIKNPEMTKIGGDRREVTILFADVRGFTTFSEKHPPEYVVHTLNEYLDAMVDVIFKWDGTLDKFIGDAILAFWGAPLKQDNHAQLAISCAAEMIAKLRELQAAKPEIKDIDIGVGLNTGEVLVGNIGSQGRKMEYTIIGDHVNLGSRVESLTRRYNCHILVTEFTIDKLRAPVAAGELRGLDIRGIERVIVKGKAEPVALYQIEKLDDPGAPSVITDPAADKIVKMTEK